jgi:hypothetical protein
MQPLVNLAAYPVVNAPARQPGQLSRSKRKSFIGARHETVAVFGTRFGIVPGLYSASYASYSLEHNNTKNLLRISCNCASVVALRRVIRRRIGELYSRSGLQTAHEPSTGLRKHTEKNQSLLKEVFTFQTMFGGSI